MVAADFTEEEGASTVVVDFMEAGSGAEGFMAADSAAAGSEAVGFTAEVDSVAEAGSEAELSVEAARFEVEPGFAEELPAAVFVEAFVAMAFGAVSVSADEALDGEAGAGAGA
jgi:hypothetical protein